MKDDNKSKKQLINELEEIHELFNILKISKGEQSLNWSAPHKLDTKNL